MFCRSLKPIMSFWKSVWLRSLELRVDEGLTDGLKRVVVTRPGQLFLHVKIKIVSAVVFKPVPLHPLSDRKLCALLAECWRHLIFVWRRWWLFFLDEVDFLVNMNFLNLFATYSERFSMSAAKFKWKSTFMCVVTGRRRKFAVLFTRVVIFKTLRCRIELHLGPLVGIVEVAVHVDCASRHFFGIWLNVGKSLCLLEEMSLFRWRIVQHTILFYFLFLA